MTQDQNRSRTSLSLSTQQNIDRLCDRFERALGAGEQPKIETFLSEWNGPHRAVLFCELLHCELHHLKRAGDVAIHEAYLERFLHRKRLGRQYQDGAVYGPGQQGSLQEGFAGNHPLHVKTRKYSNARYISDDDMIEVLMTGVIHCVYP